jgi:hypothetical protein
MTKEQVFLCHNTKDKPEVDKVRELLQQRGFSTFMDKYDFEPFKHWEKQLEVEVTRSRFAAIFVGKSGLGPWQTDEIERFIEKLSLQPQCHIGLVILPGYSEENLNELSGKWKALGQRHWVNFYQESPDPVTQLIRGILVRKNKADLTLDQELAHQKENRALRAELFRIAASKFQADAEKLYQVVKAEREKINKIEEEMDKLLYNIEEELDPPLREAVVILHKNIKGLSRKSSEFALKTLTELQREPKSKETRQQIHWFNTEIEIYLERIHSSLVTSRFNRLSEPMEHRSGFKSDIYAKALNRFKKELYNYPIDPVAYEEIKKHTDVLIKIVRSSV